MRSKRGAETLLRCVRQLRGGGETDFHSFLFSSIGLINRRCWLQVGCSLNKRFSKVLHC